MEKFIVGLGMLFFAAVFGYHGIGCMAGLGAGGTFDARGSRLIGIFLFGIAVFFLAGAVALLREVFRGHDD